MDAPPSSAAAESSDRALRAMLRLALGERSLALCLHRIGPRRRPGELLPGLFIEEDKLDRLLEFLLSARPEPGWLTLSIDDGYEDAARYVLSRGGRFPQVEFLYFVCPEKCERGAGFRWDLLETLQRRGRRFEAPEEFLSTGLDPARENARDDLRAVAALQEYRLASVELCRDLQRLPNVRLGNHTNAHLPQALLEDAEVEAEYRRSTADFERLFGPQEHFAFPFGTPGIEFTAAHLRSVRSLGEFTLWSCEGRPYRAWEREAGLVLPRMVVDGQLDWRATAALIAARSFVRKGRQARAGTAGAVPPLALRSPD